MLRLFAALPVPDEISQRLLGLQTGLERAQWRPTVNFHITLRFFGDIDTHTAHVLDAALAEIAAQKMQLTLEGVGWFGRRKPRSVWARVAGNQDLTELSEACEKAARHIGLTPEARPFTPHITLAYLRTTPLEAVSTWCEPRQAFAAGPFSADRFHLMSSHLGNGPSRYTAEAEYPLGQVDGEGCEPGSSRTTNTDSG